MAGEFKQCTNGHYYQGASCPYCKPSGGGATSGPTEVFDNPVSGGQKTTVVDGISTAASGNRPSGGAPRSNPQPIKLTSFGDDTDFDEPAAAQPGAQHTAGQPARSGGPRTTRKLVGWLVTYSFDPMGVDYKLYEGRNSIGRDMDCNITVNDGFMTGKHATLLFRAGQYALKDEMSSHGTFVNDENIGFETYTLKDGDVVRMGRTVFMVRFSMFAQGAQTYNQQQPQQPQQSDLPNEFKQCANGHYYQGAACPHCRGGSETIGGGETIDFSKTV